MEDFLKMDIFFTVTTVVAIFLGVLSIFAMYYIVKILKSFDGIMRNVHEESDDIRTDIHILRQKVRDEGMKIKHIVDFFGTIVSRRTSPHKKRNARSEEPN